MEGWASLDIGRSEEERRWLSEGGKTDEAYQERVANQPSASVLPHHASVTEAFARGLTWRLRAAEAQERERIEQELRVARRIQQELLPETTPELGGWRIATYYGPAREVGGDFYDFLELEDGRLGLVVGDATGHGMPAALVMPTTRGMLRAVVQSWRSPGRFSLGSTRRWSRTYPRARSSPLLRHPRPRKRTPQVRQRRTQPPVQAT